MPLFSYKCPKCHGFSLVDPFGKCLNVLRSGSICGYQMPFSYDLANRKLRARWDKHSRPPNLPVNSDYSWVIGSEAYENDRVAICTHGSVSLNPNNGYLFLWHAPYGTSSIASVLYATAGTVTQANGIIMPLNSSIQNLHHHYGNWSDNWQVIGAGSDLVIEQPCNEHPHEYRVLGSEGWEYCFNPTTSATGSFYLGY